MDPLSERRKRPGESYVRLEQMNSINRTRVRGHLEIDSLTMGHSDVTGKNAEQQQQSANLPGSILLPRILCQSCDRVEVFTRFPQSACSKVHSHDTLRIQAQWSAPEKVVQGRIRPNPGEFARQQVQTETADVYLQPRTRTIEVPSARSEYKNVPPTNRNFTLQRHVVPPTSQNHLNFHEVVIVRFTITIIGNPRRHDRRQSGAEEYVSPVRYKRRTMHAMSFASYKRKSRSY